MNKIKPYMAKFLKENLINIFEIDSHLDVFSEELKKLLINDFEEYGFSLEKFLVTTVVKPESDRQFMKFKDLYFRRFADIAEATINQKVSLINAQTEAQKLIINSKAQVQASNLIQDKQINRSSYFLSNDEPIKQLPNFESEKIDSSNHSNQLAYAEQKKEIIKCPKCNTELPARAKFCFECGYKIELLKENEVICPKCGEKTYKGKFCSLCGALLINKCPKCDMEIPPNAKFCLNCGEKL
jgi:membrane protease subunit (stomatin/prohibitin family)